MTYSLALLTTWVQCDAVTTYATAKQKMLNYHDNQTGHCADNLTASAGSRRSSPASTPTLRP